LKKNFYQCYFFLCSTTKYSIGQPPSNHAFKCSVTLVADTSINLLASGILGFEPVVFVFNKSDSSPVPILKYTFWVIQFGLKIVVINVFLQVVCSNSYLIPRTTP